MAENVYGSAEWLEQRFRASDHDPWGHHWRAVERHRYEVILELIRTVATKRESPLLTAMDVGSSTGHFTAMLSTVVPSVTGIDVSPTAVARARATYPDVPFETVNFPAPLAASAYDGVTCLEMLYYLDADAKRRALREIDRLLRAPGLVVLSSKIGSAPYFTPDSLHQLVGEVFEVESVHLYGSLPFAMVEKALFDLHGRFENIAAVLRHEGKVVGVPIRREALVKAIRTVRRMPAAALAVGAVLRLSCGLIRWMLSRRAAPRIANWISARAGSPRTHTVVIGRKRLKARA